MSSTATQSAELIACYQRVIDIQTATSKLLAFACLCNQDLSQAPDGTRYRIGKPHKRLAEALQDFESGDITRLLVSMPPQYGKSLLSTVLFICWYVGKNWEAGKRIAVCCYNLEMAMKIAARCRIVFESPEFAAVFPEATGALGVGKAGRDSAAHITFGATKIVFVGLKGGLAGDPVDVAIIDDPLKDDEDAASPTKRKKVISWYTSVLFNRLHPSSIIAVISTRWHKKDLTGHLTALEQSNPLADKWTKIIMPAINAKGEALDPERHDLEALAVIRANLGEYDWSRLWMQSPTTLGGNMLNPEGIVCHPDPAAMPSTVYVRFWDLASTAKDFDNPNDPDYTVGALCGLTKDAAGIFHFWCKHIAFTQSESTTRDALIIATAQADGPSVVQHVEAFGGYKDTATDLKEILRGTCMVRSSRLPGDKRVKASKLAPLLDGGNFHCLVDPLNPPPWFSLMTDQIAEFTGKANATHDDVVDALAGARRVLEQSGGGIVI